MTLFCFVSIERPVCDCCDRCVYNRQSNHDRWLPFQGAANKVTHLYKGNPLFWNANYGYGIL